MGTALKQSTTLRTETESSQLFLARLIVSLKSDARLREFSVRGDADDELATYAVLLERAELRVRVSGSFVDRGLADLSFESGDLNEHGAVVVAAMQDAFEYLGCTEIDISLVDGF